MSARIKSLSIVVVSAVAVACSKPSGDGALTSGPAANTDLVPTVTASAPTADQPLVSALEAGQRSELTLVRPAERKPLQRVVVETPAETPHHTLELGEVSPNVTAAASAPTADAPIAPALGPLPRGPMPGGGDGAGAGTGAGDGGRDPVLFPDRGPVIIIRGGMGGIDDDCKNHPQGYPAGGIAINNRMPPIGNTPVLANNPSRRPFTPGRMGGTGGGFGVPRRGIR